MQQAILDTRRRLVEDSELLFNIGTGVWLRNLMAHLNAAVSLVEVTLNMIYYKAKYDAASLGWRFDEQKLGPTHGRRLIDKLTWIGTITGKPLDNAQDEIESFKKLKEVRNHLHHFDPPVFACTIEDAATWLNQTQPLAELIWKIRERLPVPLSGPLVEMLLCPRVRFVPKDPGKRRAPQTSAVGYASCRASGTPYKNDD
ncbi:hypothetical protein WMF27_43680 [Sorangium sp. So ce281]|uniref:hypothetical protein n=1 Tax=unclassified Sorangium TaxID=2621164 RepID=UPI003F630A96